MRDQARKYQARFQKAVMFAREVMLREEKLGRTIFYINHAHQSIDPGEAVHIAEMELKSKYRPKLTTKEYTTVVGDAYQSLLNEREAEKQRAAAEKDKKQQEQDFAKAVANRRGHG